MLDWLIVNALFADGEGEKDARALGIRDGKIAFLGRGTPPPARRTLDARGALAAPGIIDVHAHCDANADCAEKLLAQGVTACLSGNCGLSPRPDIAALRAALDARGFPLHEGRQVGHGSLRAAAGISNPYAAANAAHIKAMREEAARAFDEGAAGLSFGLEYAPGASGDEVLALAAIAAERGRPVSVHARKIDAANDDSITDALSIAEKTGARLIISHLVYMWLGDSLKRTLALIACARARGLDVWADSGMWTAYATAAGSAVFDEDEFLRKGYDFTRVRAGSGAEAGRYLTRERYRALRRADPRALFIYDPGRPADIWTALEAPGVMVSTDAAFAAPGQGHPQNAATYPRFFRVMVEGGAFGAESGGQEARAPRRMSLVEALRRTSLLPARALGLASKGVLRAGADADLALFDLPSLRERAAFPGEGDPGLAPEGVRAVFVAGKLCVDEGRRVPGVMAGKTF